MKKFLIIAGSIVAAFILLAGGCAVLLGGVASEVNESIELEESLDKPKPVKEGAAFTHDGYQIAKGWKVVNEEFGGVTINGLKVTNTKAPGGAGDNPMLTFRFYKGSEVLAEVECTSNAVQQGESSAMDCFSLNEEFPKGYQEIRVADMW